MTDDKKNIGPEAEKPGEATREKQVVSVKDTPPAPEQLAPGAAGNGFLTFVDNKKAGRIIDRLTGKGCT